jgi:hypothetical protein
MSKTKTRSKTRTASKPKSTSARSTRSTRSTRSAAPRRHVATSPAGSPGSADGYLSVFNWKQEYRWKLVGNDGRVLARGNGGHPTFEQADAAANRALQLGSNILYRREGRQETVSAQIPA